MGNAASNDVPKEKKTRNHSIQEFEYLLDPSLGSMKKGSAKARSTATMQSSSSDGVEKNGSAKIMMLKQAKESGSFVSKKDILAIAGESGSSKADATTIVPTQLRDIAPPSNEGSIVHPAKWLWKHPELTLCMDEHGNTYYYNYNTQESSWDPPQDLSLPKSEITFTVTVPANIAPGQSFTVQINDTQLEVMCPLDAGAGMTLELSNGETNMAVFDSAIPEGSAEGSEMDGGEGRTNVTTPLPPQSQTPSVPELPTSVDDDTLWRALAEVAQVEVYSIKSDAELSANILTEVANGSYFPELIFQVGWAYKFNLLKGAATACYLSGGNFLDSSLYDNCDGTPRYEISGFVEWLADLQQQRAAMKASISSGILGTGSNNDYAALEKLSLSGDESKLIEGLMARRKQVDSDLDLYRSRVLAVVSVDGGPTRESLDSVFNLVKGNVQCQVEEDLMDSDEMEEEVSNYLQDRHKFVVDILLTVVMLEEELDTLASRIEEFERRQRDGPSAASLDEAELAASAAENAVDIDKELLVEQHRAALQALQAELLAKKEAQLKLLAETFDRTRGVADYVSSVLTAVIQKMCGGEAKLDDIRANLSQFVTNATLVRIQATQDEKAEVVAANIEAEQAQASKAADETLATNLLILEHERNLEKLKLSLQDSQESQARALKERLAKKRAQRATELVEAGKTVEEAEATAMEECATEEATALATIAADVQKQLQTFTEQSLADVKSAAEAAAARLEDSLNAQKSEQQRALMKRLEKRKLDCERRVQQEIATATAAGATITPEQQAVILSTELAKIDSTAEAEAALIEAQNIAAVRAVRAQMVAVVRAEHEKECERLENELQTQKEKKVKDLKARLDKKKAARAKEILSSGDSNTSSAVAVALANEEVSLEEKVELAKITAEVDVAVEDARKQVLENLVEMHQKESVRLEEDLKYQEQMQKTNLANRLDRQRKLKERELIAAAASTSTTTDATTPVPEVDIRARVEAEMAAIAAREEQALQQSLTELKTQHDKEEALLSNELTYKKTSADKRLKDRLAQRNAKAAQVESLKSSIAASSRAGNALDISLKVDAAGASAGTSTPMPAIAEAPVDDGSMLVDDYLNTLKTEQKDLLTRLALFVQFEKSATVADKQAAVKAATNKQKSENALNDLAKAAILFDQITEFLALGLKKTFLYDVKIVKDFALRCKQNSTEMGNIGAGTSGYRFTAAELTELKSLLTTSSAREQASEKILERFQRDISGRLDSQAVERRTSVAQLRANGSSVTQINTARQEMTEYHSEVILTEVEKSIITLIGVWIDPVLLCESSDFNESDHKNTQNDAQIGADSDAEDDEFPESPSRVDHHSRKRAHFGARIISWFEHVLGLLKLYSTTPFAMRTAFDERCTELKALRSSGEVLLSELSMEFRTQLQKPLLLVVMQAFLQHLRPTAAASVSVAATAQSAQAAIIAAAVKDAYHSMVSTNFDITALFAQSRTLYYDTITSALSPDVRNTQANDLLQAYTQAVVMFVSKPVFTAEDVQRAKELANRILTPMSTKNKSGKFGDSEVRKMQLIQAMNSGVERLKAEVREKYKKMGGNDAAESQEVAQLSQALQEVTEMVSDDALSLEEVNADGLLAVVEKKALGEVVSAEDVVEVQREVQKQKQLQRAQKDVQRVLQNASESENQLGVALKIEQAKRQQALHARLLNKKKKNE